MQGTQAGLSNSPPSRYIFALNPYKDEKISACIECQGNTFKRKFPLVIMIEKSAPLCLGLTCKYCAKCEIITAHQHELEHELCIAFNKIDPAQIGSDYFVIGTMDKKTWKKNLNTKNSSTEVNTSIIYFKEHMTIEVTPGRWVWEEEEEEEEEEQ